MIDHPSLNQDSPEVEDGSLLPADLERASAYARQRGATETIVFHGAARLTTAAGPLDLDSGTWMLARWSDLTLEDIPDGELVCILPERA